jgi:hypothetical protein
MCNTKRRWRSTRSTDPMRGEILASGPKPCTWSGSCPPRGFGELAGPVRFAGADELDCRRVGRSSRQAFRSGAWNSLAGWLCAAVARLLRVARWRLQCLDRAFERQSTPPETRLAGDDSVIRIRTAAARNRGPGRRGVCQSRQFPRRRFASRPDISQRTMQSKTSNLCVARMSSPGSRPVVCARGITPMSSGTN